jgi:hypothetical protein
MGDYDEGELMGEAPGFSFPIADFSPAQTTDN